MAEGGEAEGSRKRKVSQLIYVVGYIFVDPAGYNIARRAT